MTVSPSTMSIVNRVKVLSYFAVVGETVVITALGRQMLHLEAGASAAQEAKKFIREQIIEQGRIAGAALRAALPKAPHPMDRPRADGLFHGRRSV